MRNAVVAQLYQLAKENKEIELIVGDLGYGVLTSFIEDFPEQFTNVGIAEQNMTGIAAGMALEGKTVFTYSIGNFPTLRCMEQIRNDCAYHNLNVKIISIGAGFAYGQLGMSHHATEDLAMLRSLPNVVVMSPADKWEAVEAVKAIAIHPGTCYLRLSKGGEGCIHEGEIEHFEIGKAMPIREGNQIAIFATGTISLEAKKACDLLNERGISTAFYTFPTIKPMDEEVVLRYAKSVDCIVTVEEHNVMGGFGGAVAEVMSKDSTKAKLVRIGLQDEFTSVVGSNEYLKSHYGMDGESIIKTLEEQGFIVGGSIKK